MQHLTEVLLAPALVFADPDNYFYWPNLLGAGAVFFVFKMVTKDRALHAWMREALSIGGHQSARLDYQIFAVNKILLAALSTVLVSMYNAYRLQLASAVESALSSLGVHVITWTDTGYLGSFALAFCMWLGADLAFYIVHFAMHKFPILWRIHRLHHSAEVLTPFTAFRMHPFETVLMMFALFTGSIPIYVVWMALLPETSQPPLVLGVFAGQAVLTVFFANLRHSHVWLAFPRAIGWIFSSPAHHQIHHSLAPQHLNKNFALNLSLWDRLFGTHVEPSTAERPQQYGLGPGEAKETLLSAFFGPFYRG